MEEKLLDIVRGPKELIISRLQQEFPELMSDKDFLEMIRYNTLDHLESALVLSGFLPGLNETSLEHRLNWHKQISEKFRKNLSDSIYRDATPKVIDEIEKTEPYRINTFPLINIAIEKKDYNLLWRLMNMKNDTHDRSVRDLFYFLNDSNHLRLIELAYIKIVGEGFKPPRKKVDTVISSIIYNYADNIENYKYIIDFIKVLFNMTLPEVFDYYMTLRHSKKSESFNVYPEFNKLGVTIKYMKEWSEKHPGNTF